MVDRDMKNRGLLVGSIIKPDPCSRPKLFGEDCYADVLAGEVLGLGGAGTLGTPSPPIDPTPTLIVSPSVKKLQLTKLKYFDLNMFYSLLLDLACTSFG